MGTFFFTIDNSCHKPVLQMVNPLYSFLSTNIWWTSGYHQKQHRVIYLLVCILWWLQSKLYYLKWAKINRNRPNGLCCSPVVPKKITWYKIYHLALTHWLNYMYNYTIISVLYDLCNILEIKFYKASSYYRVNGV